MLDFLVDEFKEAFQRKKEQILQHYDCLHIGTMLPHQRTMQSGQLLIWLQCTTCGAKPRALSQKGWSKSKILALPILDENLKDEYKDMVRKKIGWARGYYLSKQLEAQSNRTTEWWKRYTVYLDSPQWAFKRKQVLARARGWCENCECRKAVQVHHLHYRNMGDEDLEDLLAVCLPCHEQIHGRQIA